MICGAVSTVTEYLTWFRMLRSLPALTSSLRVAGLYSTTALMTAESPSCGERERKWKLDQTECWSGRTDNSTISRAYHSSLMVAMYLATALVICYTKESLCLHVCRAGRDSCVASFITLFCRSKLAPPLTNSTTTSVLPHLAASMRAVSPSCAVTDKVKVQTFVL